MNSGQRAEEAGPRRQYQEMCRRTQGPAGRHAPGKEAEAPPAVTGLWSIQQDGLSEASAQSFLAGGAEVVHSEVEPGELAQVGRPCQDERVRVAKACEGQPQLTEPDEVRGTGQGLPAGGGRPCRPARG